MGGRTLKIETVDFKTRYWSRVDKRGAGDCWPWLGARTSNGYGVIYWYPSRLQYAHRLALLIAEDKPFGAHQGEHALHRCDNPWCVNPAHLYWGTQADNVRDMLARGRARTTLTPEEVAEIRRLRDLGVSRREVAQDFGVSITSVSNITGGHTWKGR